MMENEQEKNEEHTSKLAFKSLSVHIIIIFWRNLSPLGAMSAPEMLYISMVF